MDKNWVDNKNKQFFNKVKQLSENFKNNTLNSPAFTFTENTKNIFINHCNNLDFYNLDLNYILNLTNNIYKEKNNKGKSNKEKSNSFIHEYRKYTDTLQQLINLSNPSCLFHAFDKYLDTNPQCFNNDIVITDPYYIFNNSFNGSNNNSNNKNDFKNDFNNDYNISNCGYNLENLINPVINKPYFTNFITHSTFDNYVTVFDKNTNTIIDNIESTSGSISVLYLNEILNYNPNYILNPSTAILIKNFNGFIYLSIKNDFINDSINDFKEGSMDSTKEDNDNFSLYIVKNQL
jgi:hypothetical protein